MYSITIFYPFLEAIRKTSGFSVGLHIVDKLFLGCHELKDAIHETPKTPEG